MNLRRLLPALLALAPLAAVASFPGAFPRGDRGPRVILFEDADFRGGAIVLRPGEAVENLARWDFDNGRRANDRVSSILIEGDTEVVLFSDAQFRGEALRTRDSIRNLSGGARFNDVVSSVRVAFARDARPAPRPDFGRGVDLEKVIQRAFVDVLDREPTTADVRHYRSLMIERGWDERAVRDALRRSDEYRGPYMTARLNRLYRELLARDVDPRGFEHYRNKIIEHGWSDDDIRRDIRASAEFRSKTFPPAAPAAPREERPRRSATEDPR